MKQYLPLLANCALMDGIPSGSIPGLLACLETQLINCKKGNVILQQDDPARLFGVVLSGNVQVLRGNVQGSHAIIASLGPGELFGETFACAALPALPVNVIATASSTVLLFLHDRVICGCKQGCQSHSRLVTNLLRITAQKNLLLSRKLEIVMQRTTSDKLMAYLRFQAEMAHSSRFSIPFDRQQLADYLGGGAQRHVHGAEQAEKSRVDRFFQKRIHSPQLMENKTNASFVPFPHSVSWAFML